MYISQRRIAEEKTECENLADCDMGLLSRCALLGQQLLKYLSSSSCGNFLHSTISWPRSQVWSDMAHVQGDMIKRVKRFIFQRCVLYDDKFREIIVNLGATHVKTGPFRFFVLWPSFVASLANGLTRYQINILYLLAPSIYTSSENWN
jgi:hypothetical protein